MPPAAVGGTPNFSFSGDDDAKGSKAWTGGRPRDRVCHRRIRAGQAGHGDQVPAGHLQAQSWNVRSVAAMVKGKQPYDKDEFLLPRQRLDQVSQHGVGRLHPRVRQGAPTKALPEIWKRRRQVQAGGEAFEAETPKLVAAAQGRQHSTQIKGRSATWPRPATTATTISAASSRDCRLVKKEPGPVGPAFLRWFIAAPWRCTTQDTAPAVRAG